MIWDYQTKPLFNIIWRGDLSLVAGQRIKVTGYFSRPGNRHDIVAKAIVERDGTVHEQPETVDDDTPRGELYPLEGRIYECASFNGDTLIGVYQTVPNLFSFPNLAHHRAFLVLPEFWNFLEERSEFQEEVVPSFSWVLNLKSERFQYPDLRDSTWAIHRFGVLSGSFRQDFVQELCGRVAAKLGQLSRLKGRAAFGNKLKLHLLALSISEGRSFLLDELVHEGPMTAEHAAFVGYSVLDLLASLVNAALKLGIPEKQVSFTSVVGKDSDEDEPSLAKLFPELPLTEFWFEQQRDWIAEFRDLRHYFAHGGAAIPIHGPNERLLTSVFETSVSSPNPAFDVEETIGRWFEKLLAFYTESLSLLAAYCLEAVKPFESNPVKPPVKAPAINAELEDVLRDVLKLLFATDAENPKRVDHLYSRLESNWRKKWPLAKFRAFLASCDGFSMLPSSPISSSLHGTVQSISATILYQIDGKTFPWRLQMDKASGERPALMGTALNLPRNPAPQTEVSNFRARQSGPETGHRCAEFRFVISNIGDADLTGVEVLVTHSNLEVARTAIGTLLPKEHCEVYAITSPELGTTLPPGGPYVFVTLISEPVVIRVVYQLETELGIEWADDHRCQNATRSP